MKSFLAHLYSYLLLVGALCLFTACGGALDDNTRKAMAEEYKSRKIKRVNEEEVISAALESGKTLIRIWETLDDTLKLKQKSTLEENYGARWEWVLPGETPAQASPKALELLEAYTYQAEAGRPLTEAVQVDGELDLLVVLPRVNPSGDLRGLWLVVMKRKAIIQAL
jgi:hypothetical protein